MVNMAKDKKKSKGPQDRNSNYQMKNGNSVSKKHDKKTDSGKSVETQLAPRAKSGVQKSLISGISSSICNATDSISKMIKRSR
jgi:hypothetical protein